MENNNFKPFPFEQLKQKKEPEKTAVAIAYEPGEKAPKILATGKGQVAEKIIEKAKESQTSSSRKAAALRTTVHTAMSTKAACVCRRSLARSRCPQQTENSAPLPMHRPSSTEVRKVIRVKENPTDARADAPSARPTMRVSAML